MIVVTACFVVVVIVFVGFVVVVVSFVFWCMDGFVLFFSLN